MEKKKKAVITVTTVILILVILLIVFRPGLIKRLTGEVSSVNTNDETEVISNEFINEVCNISVDNENFMTIDGTIIMDEGEDGVATVNVVSGDLVFTKEVAVKSNDYTSFTYVLPRGEYDLRIEKEGYKTYETKVLESKNLNVTLVANKNKDIIASSKTFYNTYYDYYSDGTIHLKTVGNLNLEGEMMDTDFFYSVLGDVFVKKLAANGYDIKPVSQGGQYDELVCLSISIMYSNIVSGLEIEEGVSYRELLIEAQNKINNGQCTEDNLEDEDCRVVKDAMTMFFYDDLAFDDLKEIIGLVIEIPIPTNLIIDDSVAVLPILSGVSANEVEIGKNIMFAPTNCLSVSKIGTLTINSPNFSDFDSFASNSTINNLIIGEGISSIPSNGFSKAKINNISFPNSLTEIKENAFEMAKINGVVLPDSVKTIGNYAFSECGLKEVTLSKKLENIGTRAFSSNNITEINLPSNLRSIGDYAFQNNKLVSIVIPKSVSNLSNGAFDENDLNEIYMDCNIDGYANNVFSNNRAENVRLTIGPNVSIVNNIFSGLKLTELNLSYGVKKIGSSAFINQYIASVAIPASVEKIGDNAFRNNKITSITIPYSVTDIGNNAFGSNNLDTIYFNALNIKTMSNAFSGNKSSGCTLIISEGVKSIPNSAFSGAKIVDLTIPSSVTSIGESAFSNNLLTELPSLPSSIKNIGSGWFKYNKMTSVVIPHGIESIGDNAFESNGITNVLIPNTVKKIGYKAFYYNKIKSIVIPESVETIGNSAFYNNSFSEITIMGDQTRFNSNWTNIGFPASLKPSE